MEKETSPRQRLAEIIKRLEANGQKVTDTSDKVKSMGFIGGVGSRQRKDQPSSEHEAENGQCHAGGMNVIRPDEERA